MVGATDLYIEAIEWRISTLYGHNSWRSTSSSVSPISICIGISGPCLQLFATRTKKHPHSTSPSQQNQVQSHKIFQRKAQGTYEFLNFCKTHSQRGVALVFFMAFRFAAMLSVGFCFRFGL